MGRQSLHLVENPVRVLLLDDDPENLLLRAAILRKWNDLILENATMQGKPQTISADIELASDLLGGSVFGEDETTISDLEQTYGKRKTGSPQKETA